MFDKTKEALLEVGVLVPDEALGNISICNDWYKGKKTAFHGRQSLGGYDYDLLRLNFAKRLCADEAGLCEIIKTEAEDKTTSKFINNILNNNRFDVMYREQLELMSATGTVGAYVYIEGASLYDDGKIRGGKTRINYCKAENIIPITVVNGEVIECAFVGETLEDGKEKETAQIYKLVDNKYEMTTIKSDNKTSEKSKPETLGEVKPFSIMKLAEVNNKDLMEGYGYPKLLDSIPYLKGLELAYNVIYGDVDKADKIVLLNAALTETDKDGKPYLSDEQMKYFVLMQEKLPEQDSLIHEHNPVIRAGDLTQVFELILSLLSQQYGYGNKKYSFENGTFVTATQFILDKSAEMQSLNKQRFQAVQYINGIVKAVLWFANEYQDGKYDVETELNIDFDDSIITDKQAQLDSMRTDAVTFDIPQLKIEYLTKKYGWTVDEAKDYIAETDMDIE